MLKSRGLVLSALLLVALVAAWGATPASSAGFVVNSLGDEPDANPGTGGCLTALNTCTLRAAIQEANVSGPNTITFSVGGTINLGSGLPPISQPLTITGPGVAQLALKAMPAGSVPLLFANSSTLTVTNLTITESKSVFQNSGTLTLQNVVLSNNQANAGGVIANSSGALLVIGDSLLDSNNRTCGGCGTAISNAGTAQITNTTLKRNEGGIFGGPCAALENSGTLTVNASTFEDNRASGFGGQPGLCNDGTATITASLFSVSFIAIENRASGTLTMNGGSLHQNNLGFNNAGTGTFTNVTIRNNTCDCGDTAFKSSGQLTLDSSSLYANHGSGNSEVLISAGTTLVRNSTIADRLDAQQFFSPGAITIQAGATVTFEYSTIDRIRNSAPLTKLKGTIVAGCATGGGFVAVQSLGYNLSPETTCALAGTGDQQGVDPMLAPLANNAGFTQTQALLPGSPAIDAGSLDCPPPAVDQRGSSRPKDGNGDSTARCDIGAFEADTQAASAPAAPSGVSLSNVTSTGMNVNFMDNAANETAVEIERGTAMAGPFAVVMTTGVLPGQTTWYYPDSGLSPATQYCYRLRARNGGLFSPYSNVACGTTSGASSIPAAPSNVVLSNITDNSINVNFMDNATNETGIEIERGSTLTGPFANIVTTGVLAGATTWYYPNSGLTGGTQYCYRLRARNGTFFSPYSNVACATTTGGGGGAVPAAPSQVGLSNITNTGMHVNFVDNATNETGIDIERGSSMGGPFAVIVTTGALAGTSQWYYPDNGLAAGTQYCYRLRARNGGVFSPYSATVCATTSGSNMPPAAPSNVTLSNITQSGMNVNFLDNATDEDAIEIERALGMGAPYFVIKTTTPLPGTTTWYYPDNGLSVGTLYCYRLRSKNGGGSSAYTSPVCASTLP